MIGVVVTFRYGDSFDEQALRKIAVTARTRFEGMPGLRLKAFTLNSGKREAANFYVWDSKQAAKEFFTDELLERIAVSTAFAPASSWRRSSPSWKMFGRDVIQLDTNDQKRSVTRIDAATRRTNTSSFTFPAPLEKGPAMTRYSSILETIGKTPVVRVHRLAPPGINLYVKNEAFNPLGSVKDRLAIAVIEAAEKSGELKPGQTVIEATSGNTGIGLAMVCAAKGYPLVLIMAEPFSVERRKLMRFLGAKVVITPAAERAVGMIVKMEELAKTHGWFMTRQFENEANPDYHSRTTAREIIDDFAGERFDYWVTGYGTGGTLKGVARVLRKERPETKIIVCEPVDAPLLSSGTKQAYKPEGTPAAPHPSFKPHPMQGWAPDFIPKLTSDAVDMKLVDRILPIAGPDAIRCSKELAAKEGIFVGITSGGTLAGALQVAREAEKGATILCMLPDTAERYLTTPLFADIAADMNEEELAISRSTPSAQLKTA